MKDQAAARAEMSSGEDFLRRGDLPGARKAFEQALRLDAGLWQARLLLAVTLLRAGDARGAAPHVDRVLAVQPNIAHPYYLKARVQAQLGQRALALRWLDKAIELSPGYEEAARFRFLLRGHTGWRPREYTPARLWELAVKAGKDGELKKLRAELLNLTLLPGPGPDFGLFQAYCMLGHYREACEMLARLASSAEARNRLSLTNLGDPWNLEYGRSLPASFYVGHARALKLAKVGRELAVYLAYLKCTLAPNLPSGGRTGPAELRKLAAKGAGKYDFARYVTGRESLRSGRYAEAADDFRRALAAGYTHFTARCSLGEALLCQGRVKPGLEQFRAAAAAAPGQDKDSVRAWEGEMRLFLKQYRRAADLLENNGERCAAGWLGAAYLEAGELEKALRELKRAVAAAPEDAEARTWLGEACRRSGRRSEALRELELAGKKAASPWVHLNKALIFAADGDAVKLERAFGLAASSWPELPAAARGRLKLGGARLTAVGMARAAEYALKLCGGFRRTDKYFLPLVLGAR